MTFCTCWAEYPNKSHLLKNGKWKCVDKYKCVRPLKTIPLKGLPFPKYVCKTKCEQIESEDNMTREENIRAILESIFSGFKEEFIDIATKNICDLEQEPCDDMKRKIEKEYLFESLCEDLKKLQAENEKLRKALEQEPCEDAISRQTVLNLMRSLTRWCIRSEDGKFDNVGLLYDDVMFGIDMLPSVTPQEPKIGHWIEVIDEIDSLGNKTWHYECSVCGVGEGYPYNDYCGNCGAKMESEDKE